MGKSLCCSNGFVSQGLNTLHENLRCRNILLHFLLRFQSLLRNSCLSFFSDHRYLMSQMDLELGFILNSYLFYEKLVLYGDYDDQLPNLNFLIFSYLLFIKSIARFKLHGLHQIFVVFQKIHFSCKVFKVYENCHNVFPFLNQIFHHVVLAILIQESMLFIILKPLTYL